VATLLDEQRDAGRYHVDWYGRNDGGQQVASGIYVYRLEAGRHVETKQMTLLK
jgi:hypothetical protein